MLTGDDGELTIVKQTGSQRPAGRLWDDDFPNRMIFLGSLALADEKEPLAYGEDPDRDMAGFLERIAWSSGWAWRGPVMAAANSMAPKILGRIGASF